MSTSNNTGQARSSSALDKYFRITDRGSTVGREIRGGFVTFFAMAYILVVNPIILSGAAAESGIEMTALVSGTALVAGVMTIAMGAFANFPMAIAAGMGLNAVVAFSLVGVQGLTFQEAMGLVFWEGLLILLLVLTGFREAVFRAVPGQLKSAISVGIGLFIAFVGLINAGVIRPGSGTPVELGVGGYLAGWPIFVFLVGILVIIVLFARKVPGALLIGIIVATVVAFVIQMTAHIGPQGEDNPTGWAQTAPELSGSPVALPDFGSLGQIDFFGAFGKLGPLAVILLIFSLMLADFFDTMGTMVAVGSEAELLDAEGVPPRSKSILVIDSLSAMAGGLGGVSSNTAYVESTAGVGEGARTGFSSIVTGLLFLAAIFLSPVVALVPAEAASTALVFVGFLMMTQVKEIDWDRVDMALPAFLTIALMPFSYSISVGIGVGFISYVVIQIAKGHARKIHPLMWIVSVLFVLYFALGPIQAALGI